MTTYKVILTGVLDGLEPEQVAPQLALLCKVPVEGAKALLASQGMVIRRALNAETAAMYKAALRQVGCKALIEQESDDGAPTAALDASGVAQSARVWLKSLIARARLDGLVGQMRNVVSPVAGFAQRYAARARGGIKLAPPAQGRSKPAVAAAVHSRATGAQRPASALKAMKFLRTYPAIIAGVALVTVAAAGTFFRAEPSTGGPCPGKYDALTWTNCVGEVKFPNGERYIGELKNGQPHGQGTFTWPNGEKYVGEWRDGQRNGYGRFFWPGGDKYFGQFRNNRKHGQGTLTFANGRQYVGEFKDGQPVDQPSRDPKAEGRRQKAEGS